MQLYVHFHESGEDMRYRRKLHKRELKRQRKIIVTSLFAILLCLSFGYAAFGTDVTLNTKGNIKAMPAAKYLKSIVVSTGEGLYADTTEDGRYIYRGADPNNYIKLGNDMYRIISVESDNTLKVMKSTSEQLIPFDSKDNRYEEGTYCTGTYNGNYSGCSVWGNINTVFDKNGNNVTTFPDYYGSSDYYKLPTKEAGINTYLNTTLYDKLSDDVKNIIVKHYFNIGSVDETAADTSLNAVSKEEKEYKWKGNVGLINIYDYMNASPSDECHNSLFNNWENKCSSKETCTCAANNYIGTGQKVITPVRNDSAQRTVVITIYDDGRLATNTANSSYGSSYAYITYKPTFFLNSNIRLSGTGSSSDPYVVLG